MQNLSPLALSADQIRQYIFFFRGQRVMLDKYLANLYGVETRILLQAVKRNTERFPQDFMFQLTEDEAQTLRSQAVNSKRGGARYMPYVFTEQGVAMLSSILNSKQAIQVNIEIMRAFVNLRQIIGSHKELRQKLNDLEKKYDKQFKIVFDAIHELMMPEEPPNKRTIGFHPWEKSGS